MMFGRSLECHCPPFVHIPIIDPDTGPNHSHHSCDGVTVQACCFCTADKPHTGSSSVCCSPTSKPSLVWSWGTRKTPAQLTRQFKGRPVFLKFSAKS